jgi:hypothetical protein
VTFQKYFYHNASTMLWVIHHCLLNKPLKKMTVSYIELYHILSF